MKSGRKIGHFVSKETGLKISLANKGRKHTEETKKNMSKNHSKFWLGKHLSLETRKKLSESHKGEKSYLWKGGISEINHKIRMSFEYRLWKRVVLERDNYTCIWCGSKKNLQADHIKPFALFPELRFAIDNGRILCEKCHKTTDTWGRNKLKKNDIL